MLNRFAAYFFGYFYFFSFGADKVKGFFAANSGPASLA